MPKPSPSGYVARDIFRRLQPVLLHNIHSTGLIKHYMHLNRPEDAQVATEEATEDTMLVMRVITSMSVGDMETAEKMLLEYEQKSRKS